MSKSTQFLPHFTPAFSALEVVGLFALAALAFALRAYYEQQRTIDEQTRTIDRMIADALRRGDAARRDFDAALERELRGLDA